MKLSSAVLSFTLATALFSQIATAGVLSIERGSRTIEGVSIGSSATLSIGGSTRLDYIGSGLRTKKVLVSTVKVYVAQLFMDNAGKFVRTSGGAASSVGEMKAGAVRLTFLRGVDAATVQTSFKDAFNANGVDVNNKGVSEFLSAVRAGADAKQGRSMNISMKRDAGGVTLVYENTNGGERTIKGDSSLFRAIMSIWIGNPADSGLATLKSSILSGK
jgi:hypothetical protein